ncbi:hypothetical protein Anas_01001 [Armadillidium nasatum]|uniref:Uncharacterized protein n=1 Tax=Armadillidium nasatum TaxID=96803 RepID=A0A5N5SZX2_9CRUS|nr:hypothetical protein Anas_01001 [Armadillidium nasatum]
MYNCNAVTISILSFVIGHPYMESLRENRALLYSLLGSGSVVVALALGIIPEFAQQFEIIDFPSETNVVTVNLMFILFVFSVSIDVGSRFVFGYLEKGNYPKNYKSLNRMLLLKKKCLALIVLTLSTACDFTPVPVIVEITSTIATNSAKTKKEGRYVINARSEKTLHCSPRDIWELRAAEKPGGAGKRLHLTLNGVENLDPCAK